VVSKTRFSSAFSNVIHDFDRDLTADFFLSNARRADRATHWEAAERERRARAIDGTSDERAKFDD
jgi:hypothetical protein|tara:strand:+ start:1860 stop:2054 length:195 start_codon:yes stop_codon:yes gene_type:complete